MGGTMNNEVVVRIDRKGRIVIPSKIRRRFNMKNIVKIVVTEDDIRLKPVKDPLDSLRKLVVKGTTDVEEEIRRLREVAERELQRRA